MNVGIGDVLLTRSKGLAPRLIRIGAALLDRPNVRNHVVIAHHIDKSGTFWGIEGRPGGVGWVDIAPYVANRYTLTNTAQPKNVEQRKKIADISESLLQRPYDWGAIAIDAMIAIGADRLWGARDFGEDEVPAHVVCSSLADYVYERVGLASPGKAIGTRFTTPADWDDFITTAAWEWD